MYDTLGVVPGAPLLLVELGDVVITAAKDGAAHYLEHLLRLSPNAAASVRASFRSRQAAGGRSWDALMHATVAGSLDSVDVLLRYGASVEATAG